MGFDDIFENSHKHRKEGHYRNYDHEYGNRHNHSFGHNPDYGHDDEDHTMRPYYHKKDFKQQLLERLQNDPKLKSYIVLGGIAALIILIIAVLILLPFLLKLLNYLGQNGLQGVIDTLWKGTN